MISRHIVAILLTYFSGCKNITWLWVKNTGHLKNPGLVKGNNNPKPVVPKGDIFLTHSHIFDFSRVKYSEYRRLPVASADVLES